MRSDVRERSQKGFRDFRCAQLKVWGLPLNETGKAACGIVLGGSSVQSWACEGRSVPVEMSSKPLEIEVCSFGRGLS